MQPVLPPQKNTPNNSGTLSPGTVQQLTFRRRTLAAFDSIYNTGTAIKLHTPRSRAPAVAPLL